MQSVWHTTSDSANVAKGWRRASSDMGPRELPLRNASRATPRDVAAISGRGTCAGLDLERHRAVYESKPKDSRRNNWVKLQAAALKAIQQSVGLRGSCGAIRAVGVLVTAMMLQLPQWPTVGRSSCNSSSARQARGCNAVARDLRRHSSQGLRASMAGSAQDSHAAALPATVGLPAKAFCLHLGWLLHTASAAKVYLYHQLQPRPNSHVTTCPRGCNRQCD